MLENWLQASNWSSHSPNKHVTCILRWNDVERHFRHCFHVEYVWYICRALNRRKLCLWKVSVTHLWNMSIKVIITHFSCHFHFSDNSYLFSSWVVTWLHYALIYSQYWLNNCLFFSLYGFLISFAFTKEFKNFTITSLILELLTDFVIVRWNEATSLLLYYTPNASIINCLNFHSKSAIISSLLVKYDSENCKE